MTAPRVQSNRYLDRLAAPSANRYLSRLEGPDEEPDKTLLDRAGDVARGVGEFAKEAVLSIPRSAKHALLSPVEGSRVGPGRAGVLANYGGGYDDPERIITKENEPEAISRREMLEGAAQTATNVAAGPIASVGRRVAVGAGAKAGGLLSRAAGSALSGGVSGAAYAPDDPGIGFAIGAGAGTLLPGGKPKPVPAQPRGLLSPPKPSADFPARQAGDAVEGPAIPVGRPTPRVAPRVGAGEQPRALLPTPKPSADFPIREAGELQGPAIPVGRPSEPTATHFDKARTEGGSRRPVQRVSTPALVREFYDYTRKIDEASHRAVYRTVTDADKGSEIGAVTVADRRGPGPSRQAKALRNLDDYERNMAEISAELHKRGVSGEDFWKQLDEVAQDVADPDAAFERKAIADEGYGGDASFASADYDDGFTAFDIGGVVAKGLKNRLGQSAALGTGGLALQEADDERLQATGKGIVGLAAIRAGYPALKKQVAKGSGAVRASLEKSEAGRRILGTISQDLITDPRIIAAGKDYERTRALGRARGAEAEKLASSLGPSGDRQVSDIIEGEAFEKLSPEDGKRVLEVAQKISDEFTELGQKKVDTGLLRSQTVAKREGKYLPRMYAAHMGEGPLPSKVSTGAKKIRLNAERARDDALSPEARNALGEVRESSVRASVGLERGYNNVAAAKLLNDVAEIPDAVDPGFWSAIQEARTAKGLYAAARDSGDKEAAGSAYHAFLAANHRAKGARVPEGYTRLPDAAGLGELRGAVVRKDVADYLNMVPDLQNPPNLFGKFLTFWKRAHTVWNPGTHVGNVFSNVAIAHMGGLPLHQQVKALPQALRAFRQYDADTRFLAERGVLDRGLPTFGDRPLGASGERLRMSRLTQTTRPETKAVLESKGVRAPSPAMEGARKVGGAFEKAYAMEDGVYRVALFKKLVAEGMARDKAADFVQAQFVDYGTRSPALTAIKNTVSPFIMFPAKAVPRMLDQIVEHPVRWMTLAALWGGLDQYSRRQFGAIDETDLRPGQRGNKYLGYLLPGPTQLPGKAGPRGERPMMDVSRWTPLSALTGSPVPGSLGTSLGEDWPGILTPTGPLVDIGARFANRDPFTGDEWMQPGDSPVDKARRIGGAAASLVSPSAASFHLPRVTEDLRNKDYPAAGTDALGFVGLRPTMVRPGMQRMGARIDLERAVATEKKSLARALRKAANNPELQDDLRERAQERVERLVEQYRRKAG